MFFFKRIILLIFTILLASFASADAFDFIFSGGPDGGTFNPFARGITDYVNANSELKIKTEPSSGSVENLQKVNNRVADLGITYSGDLYLGRNGFLGGSRSRQYRNVHALAYLYGAPAHLIVLKNSEINSVKDLAGGKKVAIGRVGSGAAAAGKRFFMAMGVWSDIQPQFLGYTEGAEALIANQVDALWVFAGFPNASVTRAASMKSIKLLPVYEEAKENGKFFEEFPFYQKVVIPAGTYQGIDEDINSFQDSTILTAGKRVPASFVKTVLDLVYTKEGLEHLVKLKSTAKAMSLDSGTIGIVTPMHKGAIEFWQEKGKALTEEQIN